MDCQEVQLALTLHGDKPSEVTEWRILKAHLAQCEECQMINRSIERSWGALDSLPEIDLDPSAWNRFQTRMEKQKTIRRTTQWLWAASFFVFIGIAFFLFAISSRSTSTISSPVASNGENAVFAELVNDNLNVPNAPEDSIDLDIGNVNTTFEEQMFDVRAESQ